MAVACGDVTSPAGETVSIDDLLVLPLQAGTAPPVTSGIWVRNGTETESTIRHPDDFATLFIRLRFPAGSLARLDGTPVGPTDSVRITVTPFAGEYGFTLSPAGLAFGDDAPTVRFSFGLYADLSVADDVAAFADRSAYAAALEVWEEITVGRWRVAGGSSPAGVDAIQATLAGPGAYMVAARR